MCIRLSPAGVVVALLLIASFAAAQEMPEMDKTGSGQDIGPDAALDMCHQDGVGVGGYDLVSYHLASGPVAGAREHQAEYDGLVYLFANASNRATFVEEPERHLPAYSGFCAITLALGRITCPEYTNYQIEDGRLYLFEVTGFTNGRTLWNTDADRFRQDADLNFTNLLELQ